MSNPESDQNLALFCDFENVALGVQDAEKEETEEERRQREQLLNGPALNGPEVSQSAVDDMFADADGPASQDDIDALFS